MEEVVKHFRIMTFNTQLLYNPGKFLQLDFNESSVIEARAGVVRDEILSIPEDEAPDVVCLNEVLYVNAKDVLDEGLKDRYPYSVWVTVVDGKYVAVLSLAGMFVGTALGGSLGTVVGLGLGTYLGFTAGDFGVNPGVMILSRTPFTDFEDVAFEGVDRVEHEQDGVVFSSAFLRYDDSVGSDYWAAKGLVLVRVTHPFIGAFNIMSTHLQASYPDDCPGEPPVHKDRDDCRAYPHIRARQISQIIGVADAIPPAGALGHTLVLGDLNVHGETATTSYVERDGAWVSEYESLMNRPQPASQNRKNFFPSFGDQWPAHASPPPSALPSPDMFDEGTTNIDAQFMTNQRLDYILLRPKAEPDAIDLTGLPPLVPHMMIKRLATVSDHESLEAAFSFATEYCSPSTAAMLADFFAQSQPGAGGNVSVSIVRAPAVADLSQGVEKLPELGKGERKPYIPMDRYEWFLLEIRAQPECLKAVQRKVDEGGMPAVDGEAYCAAHGRATGTYAAACLAINEDTGESRYLPIMIVYADCLSRAAEPQRMRTLSDVPGMPETLWGEVKGTVRGRFTAPEKEPDVGIYGASRPVYLRTFVPAGFKAFYVVTRFMGTTCESAIELKPWEPENTAWPVPSQQVPQSPTPESHQRWYAFEVTGVPGIDGYACQIAIHNPSGAEFDWEIRSGDCGGTATFVANGAALSGKSGGGDVKIEWTAADGTQRLFLFLDWHSPDKDMTGVSVSYRPQVSWFCDTDMMRLTAQCVEETSGMGSDEVNIKFYRDGSSDPSHFFEWKDADSGERIPGADCRAFGTLRENPIAFGSTLKFRIYEGDGVTGSNSGETIIHGLTDDAYARQVDQKFELSGSGKYRVTGTLCRNREGQYR